MENKELKIWEWRTLPEKAQNDILNQMNAVEALTLIKTIKEYESK